MSESIVFISGRFPRYSGPLGRFLPPIPEGIARTWLCHNQIPGTWILDPFGVSPRLVVEAAQVGFRVLVAANNPIARFLLEMYAQPPTRSELRAALADLAISSKGKERIEPHIRSLYLTECALCGQQVEAKAFVWERDNLTPSGRIYHCINCKDSGERPTTKTDDEQATRFSTSGLHRARALERVTPMDDPDRIYVEDALAMYLPRTVYALFTLVNKLDSLPPNRRRLLEALFLVTFDHTNVLWSYPSGRGRPRQLIAPPRFLEKNVWISLEEAIEVWTNCIAIDGAGSNQQVPLSIWPNQPPPTGGICLFEGPLRDLADQLKRKPELDLEPGAVITALPRPNQAYWTLSALWAGWLWGHQASAPFKSVLRRRRYDWSWHTVALHAAFYHLVRILKPLTPCLGLIGEMEPGFLSAAILAADISGMDLAGISLRSSRNQAQISWLRTPLALDDKNNRAKREQSSTNKNELLDLSRQFAQEYLRRRGEPATYMQLHAATLESLVQSHQLATSTVENSTELIHSTDEIIQETFSYRGSLSRYGGSSRSLEVGYWWLDKATERSSSSNILSPLSDRIEREVVRFLQENPGRCMEEIDQMMCMLFTGLLTPDLELIEECVYSYGEKKPPDSNRWQLREQDSPPARRKDVESIKNLIGEIGERLCYQVESEHENSSTFNYEPIIWREGDGSIAYTFYVLASAVLGDVVHSTRLPRHIPAENEPEKPPRNILVIPGGRSNLVGYKLHHNPRLKSVVEAYWRFVKFRHMRWLAESDLLSRENLDEQFDRDPPATQDPQLSLL